MFTRASIQSLVDQRATLPHLVTVLAPFSFEIRPAGFRDDEPNYRVVAERAAFRLRATVSPDYLAVAIVSAVVSGATSNPGRVEAFRRDLQGIGWNPRVELTNATFVIEATYGDVLGLDDDELSAVATSAALLMSEFVLDQLVITRPLGEMRSAVDRAVTNDPPADPWMYDPSERDRSTQVHRSLENWLIASLRERGVEPMDPAGEPFFDLAWVVGSEIYVCEVKSSTNSETHQLRLGIGQVVQYRELLEQAGWASVRPVLLIEREPRGQEWVAICDRLGVLLLWPTMWPAIGDSLTVKRDK
jgi:hypothetical protein